MISTAYGEASHPDPADRRRGLARSPRAATHERGRRPADSRGQRGGRRAGALRALRAPFAAHRGARVGGRDVLQRRACAARAGARQALMQAPLRYPELFLAPRERTPESFWISLGYFNLYRVALATLLLTQAYWVLGHDAAVSSFVQPGLLAMGCFAATGVTGWLAGRVAANERLATERGRALATQMRVNELVQRDMHDGMLVLDRDGH